MNITIFLFADQINIMGNTESIDMNQNYITHDFDTENETQKSKHKLIKYAKAPITIRTTTTITSLLYALSVMPETPNNNDSFIRSSLISSPLFHNNRYNTSLSILGLNPSSSDLPINFNTFIISYSLPSSCQYNSQQSQQQYKSPNNDNDELDDHSYHHHHKESVFCIDEKILETETAINRKRNKKHDKLIDQIIIVNEDKHTESSLSPSPSTFSSFELIHSHINIVNNDGLNEYDNKNNDINPKRQENRRQCSSRRKNRRGKHKRKKKN